MDDNEEIAIELVEELSLIEELANELGLEIFRINIDMDSFIRVRFVGTNLSACIDMFRQNVLDVYRVKLDNDTNFYISLSNIFLDRNEMLRYINKYKDV